MRKINTQDVFEGMRLIQKSGLKDKLVPVIKDIAETGKSQMDAGIIGVLSAIETFSESKCEHMIYEWLAGPCEMEPREIAEMDLGTLADMLEELGKENDVRRFFSVLSGLLTKKA